MGCDPQDGAVPEYISAKVHNTAHQEAGKEARGWELGLPSAGGRNDGNGL